MGLIAVTALCDCNCTGKEPPNHRKLKCNLSPKDVLTSCKPALKAARKSKCGPRRMLFFIIFVMIAIIVVYCTPYVTQGANAIRASVTGLRRPRQPPERSERIDEPEENGERSKSTDLEAQSQPFDHGRLGMENLAYISSVNCSYTAPKILFPRTILGLQITLLISPKN